MVSVAWAKTRCHRGMPGCVMPIPYIAIGRFIGIYPLKQFAPVIHGKHRARAASHWAKNPAEQMVSFGPYQKNKNLIYVLIGLYLDH